MFWHGWLICREYWKQMAESIRDLEWKNTRLTEVGVQILPKRPGIYVICAKPPDVPASFQQLALCNPMYIGKADNLSERVGTHFNRPDENIEELRAHFCAELSLWYAVADINSIEDIEDKMLFCFWPGANRRIKILGKVSIKGFDGVLKGRAAVKKPVSANYDNKGEQQ